MKHHTTVQKAAVAWIGTISLICGETLLRSGIAHAASPATKSASSTSAPTGGAQTIRVSLVPLPKPALKYQLLPDLTRQTKGNAAVLYLMAVSLVPEFISMEAENAHSHQLHAYLDLPLAQLRIEADNIDGRLLRSYENAIHAVSLAARRQTVEWDMPYREEGMATVLPHLNQTQRIARALALKARVQIARGQHDDAIETLQVGYAMSRHYSNDGVLVQSLISAHIAELFADVTKEFVQQPEAPNLYWALNDLPRPFVSMREALRWERVTLYGSFSSLRGSGYPHQLTTQQWQSMFDEALVLLTSGNERAKVDPAQVAEKFYPRAKAWLVAHGTVQEKIDAMSVREVAGRAALGMYDEVIDEMITLSALPNWQTQDDLASLKSRLAGSNFAETGNPLMDLIPKIQHALFRATRLDQRLAALQTIEAIRAHAAANEGNPPASLADVSLPLPMDPVTGKLFEYTTKDKTFQINGPAPGENVSERLTYDVTIQ